MNSEKAEKIRKHFETKLPEIIHDSSDYPMLLMALGEKPAALTMNASEEEIEAVRDFCNDFGFEIRVRSGRTSKPEDALGNRPKDDGKCIFVARDEERFEILEKSEGRFYGYSDEAVGEFLGFPDEAIEFFNSTEQPGMESRKKIEELKDEINDIEFVGLTTYIPPPRKEELERAAEIGKERVEKLRQLDREIEPDIGSRYIEKRLKTNSNS